MEYIVDEGRQVTLVLSVGYWVWFPEVPQDYLDFLDALSKRAAKVVILSIPTVHVTAHTGKQARPAPPAPCQTGFRLIWLHVHCVPSF